jgi:hypothetical protein
MNNTLSTVLDEMQGTSLPHPSRDIFFFVMLLIKCMLAGAVLKLASFKNFLDCYMFCFLNFVPSYIG